LHYTRHCPHPHGGKLVATVAAALTVIDQTGLDGHGDHISILVQDQATFCLSGLSKRQP
jgi:hypothetical protein